MVGDKNNTLICGLLISMSWWRHQMETFSALPVPGEFPTQRPVTRSFDVYFDLRPNKRLSKQSLGWWFETPGWSLWRHHNGCYFHHVMCGSPKNFTLLWRHNEQDSVYNHQPRGCLLDRLFRRRSKKTSKLRVTGLCVGNSPGPVNSPPKGPVTRKMFPFDDVIMMGHSASHRWWFVWWPRIFNFVHQWETREHVIRDILWTHTFIRWEVNQLQINIEAWKFAYSDCSQNNDRYVRCTKVNFWFSNAITFNSSRPSHACTSVN